MTTVASTAIRRAASIGAVIALATAVPASAGRPADSTAQECLVGLVDAQDRTLAGTVHCTDGDMTCDADGTEDGTCTFRVRPCVNLPDVEGCAPREIRRVKAVPRRLHLAVTPSADASVCGDAVDVGVPLRKNGDSGRLRLKARARGVGPGKPDVDKAILVCDPGGCPANPDGGPSELTLTVGTTGNDLDIGYTGRSHNSTNPAGAQLSYCLSGCDGDTNSVCQAEGATGAGTRNHATFGPPLPLFSTGVAVCVVNRFEDPTIRAVVDVASGAFDARPTPLRLLSEVHNGTAAQVCPRCVNAHCDGGQNVGGSCRVDGRIVVNNPPNVINAVYEVSRDCLPNPANRLGTPEVVLPLTTDRVTLRGDAAGDRPCAGQPVHDDCGAGGCADCSARPAVQGGINQTCCTSGAGVPCFPTAGAEIARDGVATTPSPPWPDPTYPKTGDGTLAAVFCVTDGGSNPVNASAGLPGPGALLLSGSMEWSRR